MPKKIDLDCSKLDSVFYTVIRIDASEGGFSYKTSTCTAEHFESDPNNADHVAILRDNKTIVSHKNSTEKKYI